MEPPLALIARTTPISIRTYVNRYKLIGLPSCSKTPMNLTACKAHQIAHNPLYLLRAVLTTPLHPVLESADLRSRAGGPPRNRIFQRCFEREVRFLGETEKVLSRIKDLSVTTSTITQFYIRRAKIGTVLKLIHERFGVCVERLSDIQGTTARIRRTETNQALRRGVFQTIVTFELTLKGKKVIGKPRIEQNLSISSREFELLMVFTSRATMEKTRISANTYIVQGKKRIKAKLDIDIVSRCGERESRTAQVRSLPVASAPYCFVEVEVSNNRAFTHLIEGGAKKLLAGIVRPIDTSPKQKRRMLSMSYLAKSGWSAESIAAARQLLGR